MFVLAVGASLINGLAFPLLNFLSARVAGVIGVYEQTLQTGYPGDFRSDMFHYIVFLAILAPSAFILGAMQGYLWLVAGEQTALQLRKSSFQHHMGRNQSYHDEHGAGEFCNMVTRDVMKVREAVGEQLGRALTSVSAVLFALALGFYTEWKLAVIIIGASIVPIVATSVAAGRIRNSTAKVQRRYKDISASTLEVLSNIRTVFTLTGEPEELSRYNTSLRLVSHLARSVYVEVALWLGLSSFFMDAILSPVFLFAGWLVVHGLATSGNIINTFLQVSGALSGINQIVEDFQTITNGQAAANALFDFFDDSEIELARRHTSQLQPIARDQLENDCITFRNVNFSYPSRPDVIVLHNLCLEVPHGMKIAFVGRSGSGKSTLVQLLLQLHDVNDGSICVGDINLKTVLPRSWREILGLVDQEPVFFKGTVADNLALGCLIRPSRQAMIDACKLAQVDHVMDRLPLGYDTIIAAVGGFAGGGGGLRVSGGEKQRLAIARALLRKPKFMIFDECTSALDVNTEKKVQDAIDVACKDITCFIVAHRLSTVRNADCICVMENGRIVEKGSHAELLAMNGLYAGLIAESIGGDPSAVGPEAKETMLMNDGDDTETEGASADVFFDDAHDVATRNLAQDDRTRLAQDDHSDKDWYSDRSSWVSARVSRPPSMADAHWIDLGNALPHPGPARVAWDIAMGWYAIKASFSDDDYHTTYLDTSVSEASKDLEDAGKDRRNSRMPKVPKAGDKEAEVDSTKGHQWLWQLVKTEKRWVSLGLCGCIFLGGLTPLQSLIMANNFSVLSEPDNHGTRWRHVIFYSCLFLGFAVLGLIGRSLRRLAFSISGTYLANRVRSLVFGQLLSQDMYFYDQVAQSASGLATMLTADPDVIERLLEGVLGSLITMTVSIAIALGIAMGASWKLTLFMFACAPFIVAANYAQLKGSSSYAASVKAQVEKAGEEATSAVANVKTIVCMGKEEQFIIDFENILNSAFQQGRMARLLTGLAAGANQSFFILGYVAAFVYIYHLLIAQTVSFHDVLVVVLSVMWVAQSLGTLSAASRNIGEITAVLKGLHKLKNQKAKIRNERLLDYEAAEETGSAIQDQATDKEKDKKWTSAMQGRIVFEDVKFSYPALPDKEVLKGFSLTIEPGQTVALIGPSGSGKSTVASLLSRLYDPISGSITIDSVPLPSWDLTSLRRQVAVVEQDPVLFSQTVQTIRENIVYGASAGPVGTVTSVTESQLLAAAAVGALDDFVSSRPDAYDSIVGTVSGGQKQRLAIARACIRSPRLLILDEATSALDVHNEKLVRGAIETLSKGITTVIIAHRLSTVRHVDKIVVLSMGAVLESGTHADLMALTNGVYRGMILRQQPTL